jgi:hypothetical protein
MWLSIKIRPLEFTFACALLIYFTANSVSSPLPCEGSLVLWARERFVFRQKGSLIMMLDRDFGDLVIGFVKLGPDGRRRSSEMRFSKAYGASYRQRKKEIEAHKLFVDEARAAAWKTMRSPKIRPALGRRGYAFFSHDLKRFYVRTENFYWVLDLEQKRLVDRILISIPETGSSLVGDSDYFYVLDRHMAHFDKRDPRSLSGPEQIKRD